MARATALAGKLMLLHASPTDIYAALVEAGVAPCVAVDWANEPHRRAFAAAQRERREMRTTTVRGARGDGYRSIIKTRTERAIDTASGRPTSGERECQLHATKGWRSYRK